MSYTAFVMLPVRKEFDEIKIHIRKAANICGVVCIFANEISELGKINEQIVGLIKSSDFCICDVSSQNPNVAWEYGFAMAQRKHVFLLSQNVEDLFFDIKDNRAVIYKRSDLVGTLQNTLVTYIESLLQSTVVFAPENLVGAVGHTTLSLGVLAPNLVGTKYSLFDLMDRAKKRIFIAGQNLHFISIEANQNRFIELAKKFLSKSNENKLELMLCDEKQEDAICTWEYVVNTPEYRNHLNATLEFLRSLKSIIDGIPELAGRFIVKQFKFVPLTATFIDPQEPSGLAVITPNSYENNHNKRMSIIFSRDCNKAILDAYWDNYHFWFESLGKGKSL